MWSRRAPFSRRSRPPMTSIAGPHRPRPRRQLRLRVRGPQLRRPWSHRLRLWSVHLRRWSARPRRFSRARQGHVAALLRDFGMFTPLAQLASPRTTSWSSASLRATSWCCSPSGRRRGARRSVARRLQVPVGLIGLSFISLGVTFAAPPRRDRCDRLHLRRAHLAGTRAST